MIYETKQQVFDTVARHLILQGERSTDSRNTCLYRGPGGKSCAIGCLIPEWIYGPIIEGTGIMGIHDRVQQSDESDVSEPLGTYRRVLGLFHPSIDVRFLAELQDIHDLGQERVTTWRESLKKLAEGHSLNTEALDAL